MAIEATQRKQMRAGTKLIATYKQVEYTAEVVAGEDGKLRYRLADGREFKSPSAAGSAVMGGVACNGWRFWRVAGDEPGKSAPGKAARAGRAGRTKKAATGRTGSPANAAPARKAPAN